MTDEEKQEVQHEWEEKGRSGLEAALGSWKDPLRLRTLPLPEGCGEQRPSVESRAPVKKEGEAMFREEGRI